MNHNKYHSILFVGNHLSSEGKNRGITEELSTRLQNSGWNVFLTSRRLNKFYRLIDMLWTIISQQKHYQIVQVDVYSGQAFIWAYLSGILLHWLHKPFILTLHGGDLPGFSTKHAREIRKLFSYASAVTSPSNYLIHEMRMFRCDILLIPNGIDISLYPNHVRTKLSENKLIWLRAFHSIYNPSLIPYVLCELKKSGISTKITMIGPDKGDGSLKEMLELAKELGVENGISYIQGIPKNQVPQFLSEGDIFLNTANIDNTPVSVIEALACGLCIISTNVGGISYLLENDVDALLVQRKNPAEMAQAVKRILVEPGLAAKLSTNACNRRASFDWDNILNQWQELIANVLDGWNK